jgi:hypothetical protein
VCIPGEVMTVREKRWLFAGTTQHPCPRRAQPR